MKLRESWAIALALSSLSLFVVTDAGFAQNIPLALGELNVIIHGTARSIDIQSVANLWGKRSANHPRIDSLTHFSSTGVEWHLVFIDRGGEYDHVDFAYGIYKIQIGNDFIFVDYRDNDYYSGAQGGYNADMWINYYPADGSFYRDNKMGGSQYIQEGGTRGVWQDGFKASGTPRTDLFTSEFSFMTNYPDCPVLCIDGQNQQSTYTVTWNLADPSHTISAPSPQQGSSFNYTLMHWSDNQPQTHQLSVALHGGIYLAQYFGSRITGPAYRLPGQSGTWTATHSEASQPFHYQWWYRPECLNKSPGSRVTPMSPPCGDWYPGGNDSPTYQKSATSDFSVRCDITDAHGIPAQSNVIYVGVGSESLSNGNRDENPSDGGLTNASTPDSPYSLTAYPDPFNPVTSIMYRVQSACDVKLVVYDLLGREVSVLVNERKLPGSYGVQFDASHLPSGVYPYRIQAGRYGQTEKMILLR
jgi:hypothetical protein